MRQTPEPAPSQTLGHAAASRSGASPGVPLVLAPNLLSGPEVIPDLQRTVGHRQVQRVRQRPSRGDDAARSRIIQRGPGDWDDPGNDRAAIQAEIRRQQQALKGALSAGEDLIDTTSGQSRRPGGPDRVRKEKNVVRDLM